MIDFNPIVINFAATVGVALADRSEGNSYSFDGKSIANKQYNGQLRKISDVIHDIAHWLVAPPWRRKKPEFGLGNSPDIGTLDVRRLVSINASLKEEAKASLLGILIEKHLGFDSWKDTWYTHSWDDPPAWGYRFDPDGKNGRKQIHPDLVLDYYTNGKLKPKTNGLITLNRLIKKNHIDTNLVPTGM